MGIEYIFSVDLRTGEVALLDDHDGELAGLYNAKSNTVALSPPHLKAEDFRHMATVVWEKALVETTSSDRVLH